jgi:hypothetical protein
MSESTTRRTRYKDWASDGRKAARMAFGALAPLSAVSRSFALLALAGKASGHYFSSLEERLNPVFIRYCFK